MPQVRAETAEGRDLDGRGGGTAVFARLNPIRVPVCIEGMVFRLVLVLGAGLLSGCAAGSTQTAAVPAAPAAPVGLEQPAAQPALRWPVRTVPHVDLWLHSFAMLSDDSSTVPLYRRGYRDSITVIKNQRNLLTALDGNRETLIKGLRRNGYLGAQFLPFGFANWEELRASAEQFLQLAGDVRRAPTREAAMRMQQFASVFGSATDREWLRLFLTGVQDEGARFFLPEHQRQLRERAATITAVDSLWQKVYRDKFERFLNNTSQRQGDMVLSLPIGGEGRTGPGYTGRTMVAVTYPARPADAVQVLLVFAHEATGALVGPVVSDNTTPAEQRSGVADKYVSSAQVQAGAMLLAKLAPELLAPYQRYYLAQSGQRVEGALAASFERSFSLPGIIRDALSRQIDIVLSGI